MKIVAKLLDTWGGEGWKTSGFTSLRLGRMKVCGGASLRLILACLVEFSIVFYFMGPTGSFVKSIQPFPE